MADLGPLPAVVRISAPLSLGKTVNCHNAISEFLGYGITAQAIVGITLQKREAVLRGPWVGLGLHWRTFPTRQ